MYSPKILSYVKPLESGSNVEKIKIIKGTFYGIASITYGSK